MAQLQATHLFLQVLELGFQFVCDVCRSVNVFDDMRSNNRNELGPGVGIGGVAKQHSQTGNIAQKGHPVFGQQPVF